MDKAHRGIWKRSKWLRRSIYAVAAMVLLCVVAAGLAVAALRARPSHPFAATPPPPAPDYSQASAWLAFPGNNGLERSTPPGMLAVDESSAPVDVFFIHPTTYTGHEMWNVAFDAPDSVARLNPPVLLDQVSVFNGCCRLYAPHYRQASLAGLSNPPAVALAYDDIARAFRYFIAHESNGRPFILASHSQGTAHAVELLQREILATPLQKRLVAAYLIGGYVPATFAAIGLPVCASATQTGCLVSYNSSNGWRTARLVIDNKTYWWQGAERNHDQPPAVCVNPLNWHQDSSPPDDLGSLPFPRAPYPAHGATLHSLIPHLAGAACRNQMLEVELPLSAPAGFRDTLSRLTGSYHLNDYGLFYANLRQNAIDRVSAWQASSDTQKTTAAGR